MINSLTARQLITADAIIDYPTIDISSDGLILSIKAGTPNSETTTLASAFFDIHIHGAAGQDSMDGTLPAFGVIGAYLATKGVAHYLATTVTAPIDTTLLALEGIANVIETADYPFPCAKPVGIHLEGPFISHAKRGVHPPCEIQPPSIYLFERFQQAARGHIRLLTIAPEVPGAIDLIEYAAASGTKVSLGHSNATAAETRAAIAAGAVSATHTFNAMRPLDPREPGIAGVVLDSQDIYAELICDGIHISPEFVRLWLRSKSSSRAILITDGISATGMSDGTYLLGELEVVLANGRCLLASNLARGTETLAGSILTMDQAVANLQRFTGASLATAVLLASRNPAQMLGLSQLTDIAIGRPANFNVFSANAELQQTILHGRLVQSTHD